MFRLPSTDKVSPRGLRAWWIAGSVSCVLLSGCGTPASHTALAHPVRSPRASPSSRPVPTRYTFHLTDPVWTAAWQQQAAQALPAPQARTRVDPYSETTLNGVTWWVYPLPWHHRWWFAISNAQGQGVWVGRRWNQTPASDWPPLIRQAWQAAHIWQKTHRVPTAVYQPVPASPHTAAQWHAAWQAAGQISPIEFFIGAGPIPQQWNTDWIWPLSGSPAVPMTHPHPLVSFLLLHPGSASAAGSLTWNVDVGPGEVPGLSWSWSAFRHLATPGWELPLSVLLPSQTAATP